MDKALEKVLVELARESIVTVATGLGIAAGFIVADKLKTEDGQLGKASAAGFFTAAIAVGAAGVYVAFKCVGNKH